MTVARYTSRGLAMSVNVPSKRTAPPYTAEFRFYEELNDFLPIALRKHSFVHAFTGTPSVRDVIEALGVPHTEVDLVLVDGVSVDFARRLSGGERVAVYPAFERFYIGPLCRLRSRALRQTRFVFVTPLGKLPSRLRLQRFVPLYLKAYRLHEILE